MSDTCGCSRPTSGSILCVFCSDELEQITSEFPAMIGYLYDTMGGQVRFSNGRVGGRSADKPMAINETAAKVAGEVKVPFVRLVKELIGSGFVHPMRMPADDLSSMAWFAYRHLQDLRKLETVYGYLTDFRDATTRIVGVINRPLDKAYAGVCSVETDGGECPEDLYAKPGERVITCGACGFRHDYANRRSVLWAALAETLVTAKEIREALPEFMGVPINANTLRSWRARKRLVAQSTNWNGDELFLCSHVMDLALEAAQKKAG